jgi:putative ABC transport system permease protein
MLFASLHLAMLTVRRHLLRSTLSVLSIVIGIASVVTLVTLGGAATSNVQEHIESLGGNAMFISVVQNEKTGAWPRPFRMADVDAVRQQVAGIEAVSGQVSYAVTAVHDGTNWSTTLTGTGDDYFRAVHQAFATGRSFTPEEEAAGKTVCILGEHVRESLFGVANPVGSLIRVNGVACPVIGLLAERGQGGGADDTIMLPTRAVQRRFLGSHDIHWMVALADRSFAAGSVKRSLEEMLRERRHKAVGDEDVSITSMRQIAEAADQSMQTLNAFVAALAAISLVVGGIGIMNIMIVSVTERTREIGIRLAIGALSREVRLQFLAEAVILCMYGGLVGVLVAWVLTQLLAIPLKVDATFDPVANAQALGFCGMMGIVCGYLPASRAAALDPIEALRHE